MFSWRATCFPLGKGKHRRYVMSHYMILFSIIPLCCFELTKLFKCKHRNMICGISIGLVVAAVSFGLLQFTFVPVIGKLLGLIGLVVNVPHGLLGYFCLIGTGVLEPGMQITAMHLAVINLVNGVLFAYIYGGIGYILDKKLAKKGNVRKVVFN